MVDVFASFHLSDSQLLKFVKTTLNVYGRNIRSLDKLTVTVGSAMLEQPQLSINFQPPLRYRYATQRSKIRSMDIKQKPPVNWAQDKHPTDPQTLTEDLG